MASILAHFDALTDKGLKVIPLKENSKVPLCRGWTDGWDHYDNRSKLERYPNCNIGLLLGDIVDVEGDSPQANHTILELIDDYPHPMYQSSKSIHHLFLTPDPTLRHFRHEDIEFRGHGCQSVLPPSQAAGVVYRWHKTFKFPVPPMPQELVLFLDRKRGKSSSRYTQLKPGHIKTTCCDCGKDVFMHQKRYALEMKAFRILGMKWECNRCRKVDLRAACRLIRAGAPDRIVAINGLKMQ